MANYGKRLGYSLRVAGVGVNKLLALLAVLLLCSHSWGACISSGDSYGISNNCSRFNKLVSSSCTETCDSYLAVGNSCVVTSGNVYKYAIITENVNRTCSVNWEGGHLTCTYNYIGCTTQSEADSARCALNPTAEGCGNCKATDSTWYNNVVDSCNAIYGENNYALVDTNDVCEHRGRCCPMDSVVAGNSCAYRCDSIVGACTGKNGNLLVSVLRDTTVSGVDSTFYNKCYYNCAYAYNRDSSTALVLGNIILGGPSSAIADGNKAADDFSSIRSVYSGLYVYDYLNPETYEWVDSLAMTPCAVGMYRGIKNGKYVYWKAGQPVPDSVTNVVKIK